MEIKDKIIKTEKIDWQKLNDLQPVNFKNNYHSEKLKKSLVKNGFAFSIYVWEDKEENKIYIVDGHARKDILIELKNDNYKIPDQLSCTFLDLKNKKEAVRYLMQVFNQKTNPINQESMDNWLDDLDTNLPELDIDIDDLNIEIEEKEEEEINVDDEITEGEDDKKIIGIEFDKEHYKEAQELIKFWEKKELYIGKFIIDKLKIEKNNLKK